MISLHVKPVIRYLSLLLLLAGVSAVCGDVLTVRPGDEEAAGSLGYGWSYPERLSDGDTFRWIEKREGEVLLDIAEPQTYHLDIEMMPLVAHGQIQHVGIYLNNHFVTEWEMEALGRFQWFQTPLPEEWFRAGTNTLIIRSGFKASPGADPRTLSVAVKQVVLSSHE